jgi:PH and SEC7 domain-containing protein
LTEIVKYENYIDSLHAAMILRLKRRGDKALERALVVASPDEGSDDLAHTEINHGSATVKAGKTRKWRSASNVGSIEEVATPPETPQAPHFNIPRTHRREVAEADA